MLANEAWAIRVASAGEIGRRDLVKGEESVDRKATRVGKTS